MQTDVQSLVYFGKVPVHGDFVRRNAGGAAARALEGWMQEGLYALKIRSTPQVPAAPQQAGPVAFFFDAGADGALVGVMCPSRDRVGRAYPFVVGLGANGAARRPQEVPVRYAGFIERGAQFAYGAAAGAYPPDVLAARADALDRSMSTVRDAYFERFLQETSASAFWARLWGHADDTRKYLLFSNLLTILEPIQGQVPPGFGLVLRFPLGAERRTFPLEVRLWLEVVRALLRGSEARPSYFWSLTPGTDGRAFLLVTLRPPPPVLFTFLSVPGAAGDALCVLENLGGQDPAAAALSIPDRYGRLLEDERISLANFLRQI